MEHNHVHVASIAATLLHGRHEAEPHHVRAAVATARLILDEAHGAEPEAEPAPEPEPKPDPVKPAAKPKPEAKPPAAEGATAET